MKRVRKHRAWRFVGTTVLVASAALVLAAAAAARGGGSSTPSPITYTTSHQPLLVQGTSDLSSSSTPTGAATPAAVPVPGTGGGTALMPPLRRPPQSGVPPVVDPFSTPIFSGVFPGTQGWPGITGPQQAAVNGYDLEPPDQGLCVGGGHGGSFAFRDGGGGAVVMEIVNNALQAYSSSGQPLSAVIPTSQLFDLPAGAFLSDPRCYWDRDTGRWFFTEFTVTAVGTQYIAVSQTSNPLGKYTVFSFDTTDAGNGAAGCPCFGDFDQLGADQNGFYLSTNEFSISGTGPPPDNGYGGVDIWATSKQGLAAAADGGPVPALAQYAVTTDAFGQPYHVAPSQTPPDGWYAPDTEYFVESNSNALSDNHLLVYDMGNTHALAYGGFPTLSASELTSEPYTFPQNATQKPTGSAPGTTLDADFNAIQEVTYTAGTLYAELSTNATATGASSPTAAIGWFVLSPDGRGGTRLLNQGYVANSSDSFLYPDIAVDGSGHGYLLFSVSGPDWYPSPGYVAFAGPAGAVGPAVLPAVGADDENGFTCYPPYGTPGDPTNDCRWGDYSMGVAYGGRIYMSTEWIPPTPRDPFVNWGTYVWTAPSSFFPFRH